MISIVESIPPALIKAIAKGPPIYTLYVTVLVIYSIFMYPVQGQAIWPLFVLIIVIVISVLVLALKDAHITMLQLSNMAKMGQLREAGDFFQSATRFDVPRSEGHSGNRHKCFLGYAASARTTALELKDALLGLPRLVVHDWVWESNVGKHIALELDRASRECTLAVFLVTKDDETRNVHGSQPSPRDNIVFEVGFFAARIGFENTIIIVEEGTKIPTDWGGIIYINLSERSNVPDVCLHLIRSIQGRLG